MSAAREPITSGAKRPFIRPGSVAELRVLMELVEKREVGPWPPADDDTEWHRILGLVERSIGMHIIGEAFAELVDDEAILFDPEASGFAGAAIAVSLDRDGFGQLSIGVCLKEIDGGQLAHVLDLARRHELTVREESGWLRLSPHLIATADDEEREPEVARA